MNTLRAVSSESKVLIDPVVQSSRSASVTKAMKVASTLTCVGGNLSYEGKTPVLTLTAESPEAAGYAHGYLLADTINQLIRAVTSDILSTVELPFGMKPDWSTLSTFLDQHKLTQLWNQIPKGYQKEIDGVINGFNKRLEEGAFEGQKLTRNEVVLFHLLPDKQHFDVFDQLATVRGAITGVVSGIFKKIFGCTTVIGGNKETGPIFGRNLDWPSYGCLGDASMIVKRRSFQTGKQIVELSFAGFIGTLTGMNEDGLCLAMNVCDGETKKIKGVLAAFYNREILETCATAAKVAEFISEKKPLGPYHLTVADPEKAATHHLMQGDQKEHLSREKVDAKVLEAANCRYQVKQKGKNAVPIEDEYESKERRVELAKHFKRAANESHSHESVETALQLPYLNVDETVHSVVMHPKEMRMQFAFANAMAASEPMQSLDIKEMMGLKSVL